MTTTPDDRATEMEPSWRLGTRMAIEPASDLAWELVAVDGRALYLTSRRVDPGELGPAVVGWPSGDRWSSVDVELVEVREGRLGSTTVVAEMTGEVRSRQRRGAFRTSVLLDAELLEIDVAPAERVPAAVINLSAGGAAVLCPTAAPAGSSIALWVTLTGSDAPIATVARVVAVGTSPLGDDDRPLLRTSFEQIFPDDRELVARFVQQQQLARRRVR
jgi:hypothetical protein